MNRLRIIKTYIIITISIIFASCDKLPEDGPLPGMWQLVSIELPDGTIENVLDNQVYWCERQDFIQFHSPISPYTRTYARLNRTDDTFMLYDFSYLANTNSDLDIDPWVPVSDANNLYFWGIIPMVDNTYNGYLIASYKIIKLSNTTMILVSDSSILTFRKF